jgi:hypothetical protein
MIGEQAWKVDKGGGGLKCNRPLCQNAGHWPPHVPPPAPPSTARSSHSPSPGPTPGPQGLVAAPKRGGGSLKSNSCLTLTCKVN